MNYGVVSQEQLEKIDEILTEKLIKIGVDCVIIIDMAGNIITAKDNGTSKYDVYSFAALDAESFHASSPSFFSQPMRTGKEGALEILIPGSPGRSG